MREWTLVLVTEGPLFPAPHTFCSIDWRHRHLEGCRYCSSFAAPGGTIRQGCLRHRARIGPETQPDFQPCLTPKPCSPARASLARALR
jgi:hypothetical protein